MDKRANILITGSAGFIGSCLTGFLNGEGYENLILADDFSRKDKMKNLHGKQFKMQIDRGDLFEWLDATKEKISFVFHLGARTDTTEYNYAVHEYLNFNYSRQLWNWCTDRQVPIVYASSAATYGAGEFGYSDDHTLVSQLRPLNAYAVSKNEFDKWLLQQQVFPPFWAGLKFFNAYGPNEYHKGRMASMILHSYKQIRENGVVKLFRSYREDFPDGQQLRDFIYVKDIVKVCYWLMHNKQASGNIYNLGTGKARSFVDLVRSTFSETACPENIVYVDIEEQLRNKYQYFTEAAMGKLRNAGYTADFYQLEDGVEDYVQGYLMKELYY